jgi:hypothetical protein
MRNLQYQGELSRAKRAALFGLMGTSIMTLLMTASLLPGAPGAMRPFPVEVAHHLFPRLGPLALTVVTVLLHFGYGAGAGAVFAFVARPMSVWRGLAFGLVLWVVMQAAFVPLTYGWIEFGLGRGSPGTSMFALLLHLAYGATLGFLGERDDLWHHAEFDEADRLRVA